MMSRIAFTLLIALRSWGQDSTPEGVYHIGGPVGAPSVLSRTEAQYTNEAREAKLEGAVVVHLVVEADGSPRNVTLDPRASVGFGLDEQAIECVRGWKFKPALKDGKPVPVYATVEVSFRLSQLKWQLLRVSFDLHPEASLPHLVKAVYPSSALQRGMGLTLLCDIDEKGIPNNVHAEKPDGSTEEAGMITALRDWRFTPGSNSGSPVRTAATFVFGAVEVRQ